MDIVSTIKNHLVEDTLQESFGYSPDSLVGIHVRTYCMCVQLTGSRRLNRVRFVGSGCEKHRSEILWTGKYGFKNWWPNDRRRENILTTIMMILS